ncbi:MAG: hypothetical protein IMW90_04445 [Thermogemmatispora sp.]|uniref:DUF5682 family protein n=1 Tax=Thermogemmatispora sp. TaxID=1968838 RepID=UPI0019E174BD|nr:DUF5682 family protein [Thermogemmatispora sp.]MBE3564958.1 hypothetical protein [Thermogemmatispora sp.]
MSFHLFGIRHHGPGCARSLRTALQELAPDLVLVEGPADAQEIMPLLNHPHMLPPVALLIYRPDQPRQARYYPLSAFSPEWQALRYALQEGIAARFIDLPLALRFGSQAQEAEREEETSLSPCVPNEEEQEPTVEIANDPLSLLSFAAGYPDHELWWEQQIEQRQNAQGLFDGIREAMRALRDSRPPRNEEDAWREAHMRQMLRRARSEGFQRIAVICGAWHLPALEKLDAFSEADDRGLLQSLKRVNVAATWIPWSNDRLTYASGYGAGITAPGWYELLWSAPAQAGLRWVIRAAELLRQEGFDVSTANVIETVRLAEALAALRDASAPGLVELQEAIQSVLCRGETVPMRLIEQRLVIGSRMGKVPPETPAVPLQRDLEQQQRRLRLKPSPEIKELELDLRNETDRARSRLLHRLRLLGIPWGEPQAIAASKRGTFHERWKLQWQHEFALLIIEANVWGNTLESAATGFALDAAEHYEQPAQLTELLDQVLQAELPAALERLLERVHASAALASDVRHLMDAMPALARVARYGDVRGSDTQQVRTVVEAFFARTLISLPSACLSLDEEAARTLLTSIQHMDSSILTLADEDLHKEWCALLERLSEEERPHPLLRGYFCRLLLDRQKMETATLSKLARRQLSPAVPIEEAALWLEGLLSGRGQRLLALDELWYVLDQWLQHLITEQFMLLLPLLRRAFQGFTDAERQAMGEKVRYLYRPRPEEGSCDAVGLDEKRARLVLPILSRLLEVPLHAD